MQRKSKRLRSVSRGDLRSLRTKGERLETRWLLNAAPIVNNDVYASYESVAFTRNLLANDVDMDGDDLRMINVTQPTHGSLTWQDDGTIEYTPSTDFVGVDSMTYQATDGQTTSETATAQFRVGSYHQFVLRDSPLAYWQLNERGAEAQAFDASGNGYHGNRSNVAFHPPGAVLAESEGAASFQTNSRIEVERTPALADLQEGLTIEAWVRPDTIESHGRIVANTTNRQGWAFGIFNGSLILTDFTVADYISEPAIVADGQWYQVAVRFGVDHHVEFFVNGRSIGGVQANSALGTSNTNLRIGDFRDEQFRGAIDELAIFDHELPEATLAAHYQMGIVNSGRIPDVQPDTYLASTGSSLEVTVPRYDGPRYSFVDTFDVPHLNRNLTDPSGTFVVDQGAIQTRTDRRYVRTVHSNYLDGDFVVELDVNMTSQERGIEYIGIGPGEPRGAYDEPQDSLYLRMHSTGYDGQMIFSTQGPFDGDTFGHIRTHGTHRVRLTKIDNHLLVQIDANFESNFAADLEYAIADVRAAAPHLNADNSFVFFGGSSDSSFDNLHITSSLDANHEAAGILDNDADTDGDQLTAVLASSPEHGSVTLNSDGTFAYTPDLGFAGHDTFTYYVTDGTNLSRRATVRIDVNGIPTVTDDFYTVNEDEQLRVTAPSADNGGPEWLQVIAAAAPLHWWRFNAVAGTTITDYGSAERHGEIFGGVVLGEEGRVGSAATFEGDGYLLIGSPMLRGDWTVETIFSADVNAGSSSQALIGVETGTTDGVALKAAQYANSHRLGYTVFGQADVRFTHPTPSQLTHVAMVGSNAGVSLYVDGQFVDSDPTVTALARYVIGMTHQGHGEISDALHGTIDEFVIFDRQLTADEIARHAESIDNRVPAGEHQIIGVLGNDDDDDDLFAELVTPPDHGSLYFRDNGTFDYIPDSDFTGTDTFTYRVDDGDFESETATVTIQVLGVNDVPVARSDSGFQTPYNETLSVSAEQGVLVNDFDIDGDRLTARLVEPPLRGELILNGDGSFEYTPGPNAYEVDVFRYEVTDPHGAVSQSAFVTIDIFREFGDHAGTRNAAADDHFEVDEDTPLVVDASPWVSVVDVDLHVNDFVYDAIRQKVFVTVGADAPRRPNTLVEIDPHTGRISETVRVGSNPGKVAISGAGIVYFATEDHQRLQSYDPSTGELGWSIAMDPNHEIDAIFPVPARPDAIAIVRRIRNSGTLEIYEHGVALPNNVRGPNLAAIGPDGTTAFGYRSRLSSFDFWAMDLNDDGVQTRTHLPNGQVISGFDVSKIAAAERYLFVDGGHIVDTQTFDNLGQFEGGHNFTLSGHDRSLFSYDAETRTLYRYDAQTLQQQAAMTDFDFEISDHGMIRFGNDGLALRSKDRLQFVRSDVPFGIHQRGVLRNDTAQPDTVLTVSLVEDVQHGELQLNPDGTFTYLPDADYSGADSFRYRLGESNEDSAIATVTISVNAVNDLPVAQNDVYTLPDSGNLNVDASLGVLLNDSDVHDGDDLTAELKDRPRHGTVELNPDGSFQYQANATFTFTDEFTYRADDGDGESNLATVVIRADYPVIRLGDHQLKANTANQTVELFVAGRQSVAGLDLFMQVGDGGPELTSLGLPAGTKGPAITNVDLKSGTIFANSIDRAIDLGSLPQMVNWSIALTEPEAVVADGLLATITFDTSGLFEGTWDLAMTELLPQHPLGPLSTSFAGVPIHEDVGSVTIVPAKVVARQLFYNNSSWDGDDVAANANDDLAIAVDKSPLNWGETASYQHYTNYSRGINGLMIDVERLERPQDVTVNDFEFRVGRTNDVTTWDEAPTPSMTLRPGAGASGADRFTFVWNDNAIEQEWLSVRMQSNAQTLLGSDDVFFFGNAIGEVGNTVGNTFVSSIDVIGARDHQRGPFNLAPIDNPYDFNRDQIVSATDVIIARDHQTGFLNALPLLTPQRPPSPLQAIGKLDIADTVNLFCASVARQHRLNDWNGDGRTDQRDALTFIQHQIGTHPLDVTFDGRFDSQDLLHVFRTGAYNAPSRGATWSSGDWNCDGAFDSADLVLAFQLGSEPLSNADQLRATQTDIAFSLASSPLHPTASADSEKYTAGPDRWNEPIWPRRRAVV